MRKSVLFLVAVLAVAPLGGVDASGPPPSESFAVEPSSVEVGGEFSIVFTGWLCTLGAPPEASGVQWSFERVGGGSSFGGSLNSSFFEGGAYTSGPQNAPSEPGVYQAVASYVSGGDGCTATAEATLTVLAAATTTAPPDATTSSAPGAVAETAPSSAPAPASLPRTGSASLIAALAAFAVLMLGGGLTLAARRR